MGLYSTEAFRLLKAKYVLYNKSRLQKEVFYAYMHSADHRPMCWPMICDDEEQ